jgi:hypothetical protein
MGSRLMCNVSHKGGMRIGKKPPHSKKNQKKKKTKNKIASIWCPQCKGTNAETLK